MTISSQERALKIVAWILAVFYLIGSPISAYLEFHGQVISQRFDLPAELIYFTCIIQVVSAPALFVRRLAPWAAFALSIITIGAIGLHLRIGSPITAIPALLSTVVQVWFGIASVKRSG